jgi:hypothetical protein
VQQQLPPPAPTPVDSRLFEQLCSTPPLQVSSLISAGATAATQQCLPIWGDLWACWTVGWWWHASRAVIRLGNRCLCVSACTNTNLHRAPPGVGAGASHHFLSPQKPPSPACWSQLTLNLWQSAGQRRASVQDRRCSSNPQGEAVQGFACCGSQVLWRFLGPLPVRVRVRVLLGCRVRSACLALDTHARGRGQHQMLNLLNTMRH